MPNQRLRPSLITLASVPDCDSTRKPRRSLIAIASSKASVLVWRSTTLSPLLPSREPCRCSVGRVARGRSRPLPLTVPTPLDRTLPHHLGHRLLSLGAGAHFSPPGGQRILPGRVGRRRPSRR